MPATGDASDAALVWPGGEWHPSEQLRIRLAASFSALSVEQWQVQPPVVLDERTTFQVVVKNTGDILGRFVGGIDAEGWYPHRPTAHISRQIPPGETVTREVPGEEIELVSEEMAGQVEDREEDIHYELIWPRGRQLESVSVVEE